MEEGQRIYVSIARMEEKLENIIDRLDKIQKDNQKCHEDHEDRIRDLEKTSQNLSGKLMAVSMGISAGIAFVIAWITSGGHT
jgi:uncharacterized protein YaaN involved in tellurite resistance